MQYHRHICSGAYASNVECMYNSTLGHITDCSELIRGIYTAIIVSCLHME